MSGTQRTSPAPDPVMAIDRTAGQGPGGERPILLDRVAVAELLSVSVWTLDEWRDRGDFPEPTISQVDANGRPRIVRWSRQVVERWVADGCRGPGKRGRR